MENKEEFYACTNCHVALGYTVPECCYCGKNATQFKSRFDWFQSYALYLLNLETPQDLIRYIVCDGEPADESCVGHPVLVLVGGINNSEWAEKILTRIGLNINEDTGERYENDGYKSPDFLDGGIVYHTCDYNWYRFAKKKPGYDYTRKAE